MTAIQTTSPAFRKLAQMASGPDEDIDLFEGALLIAELERPGVSTAACRATFDGWTAELAGRLAGARGDVARLTGLVRFLFEEQGFAGDLEEYGTLEGCLLDQVVERRRGIPITLSLVLMELGRRVGVPLEGVGLPGHFLVRHGLHPEVLLDSFHGGTLITPQECALLLQRISRGRIPFAKSHLRPVAPRFVLFRLLNNLRSIHLAAGDLPRTLEVVERLLLFYPGDPGVLRDRGLLRLKLGRVREGIRDVEAYLEAEPDASDWNDLAEAIEVARESFAGCH